MLPSVLSPASAQADRIVLLTIYFGIAAVIVLAIVIGSLAYVVVRFQAKPGDREPERFIGNKVIDVYDWRTNAASCRIYVSAA